MALYKLKIAYDGTGFKGFQRQKNQRTVQAELENALVRFGWQESSILAAGRTDTGVHADGQVVSFNLEWRHTAEALRDALNHALPTDVRVLELAPAPDGFHPRFHALERRYRYQVVFVPLEHPLRQHYFWRVWPKPDEGLLKEASALFLGKHDFRAFGRPPDGRVNSTRTIQNAEWTFQPNEEACFRVSAEAFLYHMVRRMVYVLIRVGQKRISLQDLNECITAQLELPAGIAPAKGLILEEIIYK